MKKQTLAFIGLVLAVGATGGCSTPPTATPPSTPAPTQPIAVTPGPQTKVLTYFVSTENFSPALQESKEALRRLSGKCWDLVETKPRSCARFEAFTSVDQLKPYKKVSTEHQMMLTALEGDRLTVRIFDWDGARVRRVLNSDGRLPQGPNRFVDFMVRWAFK